MRLHTASQYQILEEMEVQPQGQTAGKVHLRGHESGVNQPLDSVSVLMALMS